MFVELVQRKRHTVQILGTLLAVEATGMEGVGVGADDLVGDRLQAGSALLQSLLWMRLKSVSEKEGSVESERIC